MRRWRNPRKSTRKGISFSSLTSSAGSGSGSLKQKLVDPSSKQDQLLDEKLSIALQISAAMVHLHSHCIMFRDLKPTNIGFDVRGDVKVSRT